MRTGQVALRLAQRPRRQPPHELDRVELLAVAEPADPDAAPMVWEDEVIACDVALEDVVRESVPEQFDEEVEKE